MSGPADAIFTADYRRAARRIRARWSGDATRTHAALRRLNAAHAVPQPQLLPRRRRPGAIDWSASAVLGHRTAAARLLADRVAASLVGPSLPLSRRQALVRHAARLGITRFEANLIIAAVQHHLFGRPTAATLPMPVSSAPKIPARSPRWPYVLAALLLGESLLALGIWRLLF